jgi:putative Mg2+ transporter-C (MgtC) family protein
LPRLERLREGKVCVQDHAVLWRRIQSSETTRIAPVNYDDLIIIGRVAGALVIGAMIGFERTFHGRPAGFRTHSLVCIASAILMIVTVYQTQWMTLVEHDAIRTDPTRMAQGIMTGIGFLGAGVIFKEGLTVRGLTTAASLWTTAAIGILVGIGFWFAAIVGAAATLIVLALFRLVEARLPSEFYAHHMIRFSRDQVMPEEDLRKLIGEHGFSIANLSSRLAEGGKQFEYRMTIKSRDRKNAETLSMRLRGLPEVIEFRVTPTGDSGRFPYQRDLCSIRCNTLIPPQRA